MWRWHEAIGIVLKDLDKKLDQQKISGRIKTIQTPAVLKSAWILRSVWEIWKDYVTKNPVKDNQLELVWKFSMLFSLINMHILHMWYSAHLNTHILYFTRLWYSNFAPLGTPLEWPYSRLSYAR